MLEKYGAIIGFRRRGLFPESQNTGEVDHYGAVRV